MSTDSPVLITDFEMLFDPRYEIDVIKLFCDKARITNVAVKWPGKYTNSKLTYAEPGDNKWHLMLERHSLSFAGTWVFPAET